MKSAVTACAFNRDERKVAAGTSGGSVSVFDLEGGAASGTPMRSSHRTAVSCVGWYSVHDGVVFTGGEDGCVKLFDPKAGREYNKFGDSSYGTITALKTVPHGKSLICGTSEGRVLIYDMTAGKVASDLHCHRGRVSFLEFHPVEFVLATGSSADQSVRMWGMEGSGLPRLLSTSPSIPSAASCLGGGHWVPPYPGAGMALATVTSDQVRMLSFPPGGTGAGAGAGDASTSARLMSSGWRTETLDICEVPFGNRVTSSWVGRLSASLSPAGGATTTAASPEPLHLVTTSLSGSIVNIWAVDLNRLCPLAAKPLHPACQGQTSASSSASAGAAALAAVIGRPPSSDGASFASASAPAPSPAPAPVASAAAPPAAAPPVGGKIKVLVPKRAISLMDSASDDDDDDVNDGAAGESKTDAAASPRRAMTAAARPRYSAADEEGESKHSDTAPAGIPPPAAFAAGGLKRSPMAAAAAVGIVAGVVSAPASAPGAVTKGSFASDRKAASTPPPPPLPDSSEDGNDHEDSYADEGFEIEDDEDASGANEQKVTKSPPRAVASVVAPAASQPKASPQPQVLPQQQQVTQQQVLQQAQPLQRKPTHGAVDLAALATSAADEALAAVAAARKAVVAKPAPAPAPAPAPVPAPAAAAPKASLQPTAAVAASPRKAVLENNDDRDDHDEGDDDRFDEQDDEGDRSDSDDDEGRDDEDITNDEEEDNMSDAAVQPLVPATRHEPIGLDLAAFLPINNPKGFGESRVLPQFGPLSSSIVGGGGRPSTGQQSVRGGGGNVSLPSARYDNRPKSSSDNRSGGAGIAANAPSASSSSSLVSLLPGLLKAVQRGHSSCLRLLKLRQTELQAASRLWCGGNNDEEDDEENADNDDDDDAYGDDEGSESKRERVGDGSASSCASAAMAVVKVASSNANDDPMIASDLLKQLLILPAASDKDTSSLFTSLSHMEKEGMLTLDSAASLVDLITAVLLQNNGAASVGLNGTLRRPGTSSGGGGGIFGDAGVAAKAKSGLVRLACAAFARVSAAFAPFLVSTLRNNYDVASLRLLLVAGTTAGGPVSLRDGGPSLAAEDRARKAARLLVSLERAYAALGPLIITSSGSSDSEQQATVTLASRGYEDSLRSKFPPAWLAALLAPPPSQRPGTGAGGGGAHRPVPVSP